MKNRNYLIAAAMIMLALSIIIGALGLEGPLASFSQGALVGLSIVINSYVIASHRGGCERLRKFKKKIFRLGKEVS